MGSCACATCELQSTKSKGRKTHSPGIALHDTNTSAGSVSSTRTLPSQQTSTARPLPSQMAGSIQGTQNANTGALGSRDRLRARMQGGERSSSGLSTASIQHSGSYNSQYSGEGASPYVS